MPGLLHPPPSAVHGLLSVRRGGQFSKRVRRLAQLDKSVLELRAKESGPVAETLAVHEYEVTGDDATLCISLTQSASATGGGGGGGARVRLYAHTKLKYGMWLRALTTSSRWQLSNFYALDDRPPLAAGDFALVCAARDRERGARVAVKHIHVRPDGPADARRYLSRMVAREARIARLVTHQHIVRVRDVFEERNGSVYIVMDYLPHTLAHVLAAAPGGRLCERDAAHILARLLAAVAYLHGENIVHRDLKPDNVLVDAVVRPTTVLLCDFGMATFAPKRPEWGAAAAARSAAGDKPLLIAKRVRPAAAPDENVAPDGRGRPPSPVADDDAAAAAIAAKQTAGGGGGGADALSQPMHISRALIAALRAETGDDASSTASSAATLSGATGAARVGLGGGGAGTGTNEGGVLTESVTNRMAFGSGIDRLTLSSAVGAPRYVAPEVVRGHRYGPPVDVWAVGVLAFRMLTGVEPFDGGGADDVLRQIARGAVELDDGARRWHGVSDGARRFVRALMRMDARKRLTAESALENEWLTKHAA